MKWIKIENPDWLKWKRVDGSTQRAYINNPEEDYFDIAVLVRIGEEIEQLSLSSYLWLKEDTEVVATHYLIINKFELPID